MSGAAGSEDARLRRLAPLRFVAASIVVVFHFGRAEFAAAPAWLQEVVASGSVAVSFFFCLSGFVMAAVYSQPMSHWSARADYWAARVARLLPVYLVALAACQAVLPAPPLDVLLAALFVQSWVPGHALVANPPGWSLSVEAFFYALFPWLAGRVARAPFPRWLAGAFLLWAATQLLTGWVLKAYRPQPASGLYQFLFYAPLSHLNEFVVGVVAASAAQRFGRTGRTAASALALAGVLVAALWAVMAEMKLPVSTSNGMYAPLFAALFCCVLWAPHLDWLGHRTLVALGEASYAVYILQVPVMIGFAAAARAVGLEGPFHFWGGYAALVALSCLSFALMEQPLRAWLRARLRQRRLAARLGPDAEPGKPLVR